MILWKDHMANNDNCSNPAAIIKIDDKKLKSEEILITKVETSSSVWNEAGTCSVELTLPKVTYEKSKIKLHSDFSQVKVGVKLEVELGYKLGETLKTSVVFKGYVSTFDLELNNHGEAILTIQGMDAKMWMMTSLKTELKKDKTKYSAVVQGVCDDYSDKLEGKNIDVKDEPEFETLIYQVNESDYEFLCRTANLTGCMFFINAGKLYFISPPVLKSPKIKIYPHMGVHRVVMSAGVWGVPDSVEVTGIDPKDYEKTISGEVTSSDSIGSGKPASSLTGNIGEVNKIKIVDNTIKSAKEAKFLALGVYNRREMNLVELNIKLAGYPDAELGTGVTLEKFGEPIDNNFIITGIKHICDCSKQDYCTLLKLSATRFSPQTKKAF